MRRLIEKYGLLFACFLLLLLAVTGKLNGLFAAISVVIAFLVRSLPMITRYAPQLQRLWMLFWNEKIRREEHVYDNFRQSSHRTQRSSMTKEEALQVLGLSPDASNDEIVIAHRKLIAKLHPDKGGSAYLAAQINLAKKILMEN